MTSMQTLPPPGEFKTTQEIRDARFAATLARRRRRLLWWSLPVVVLVFLIALKLLSASLINTVGINAYDNENHNTAQSRFGYLEFANVVEPWKPYFNRGTAIYASGDFFAATVPLQRALDLVPKAADDEPRGELECAVRTNYSLSLEGLGNESSLAGDADTALDYFNQAQEMLADCGEDGGSGGEEAQEAEERQQESQEQAQEQAEQGEGEDQQDGQQGEDEQQGQEGQEDEQEGQDGQEDEQDGQDGQEDEQEQEGQDGGEDERDPRESELEERNQEAQREREEQESQRGGGDGSGQNW